ncbi:hypothetical protein DENSPDRAFT_886574 [Dentipellis sp. KUC8613]|nr:hypothetical protein DENSPDRAFT_886574 [Dentipellis sp. KUC8613]
MPSRCRRTRPCRRLGPQQPSLAAPPRPRVPFAPSNLQLPSAALSALASAASSCPHRHPAHLPRPPPVVSPLSRAVRAPFMRIPRAPTALCSICGVHAIRARALRAVHVPFMLYFASPPPCLPTSSFDHRLLPSCRLARGTASLPPPHILRCRATVAGPSGIVLRPSDAVAGHCGTVTPPALAAAPSHCGHTPLRHCLLPSCRHLDPFTPCRALSRPAWRLRGHALSHCRHGLSRLSRALELLSHSNATLRRSDVTSRPSNDVLALWHPAVAHPALV